MSKKISKTPRHIHDCDNCVFLGTWYRYDLYSCSTEDADEYSTNVVARYNSNGPDYTSCNIRHAKQIEEEKAEGIYKIYPRQNALIKAMSLTLKI